jgi:hypothetical protein
MKIKAGFLVSYDWELLRYSIPCVYPWVDRIWLSLDKNRLTWAGNPFDWDENGFQDLLNRIDPNQKIEIYEDCFHIPGLSTIQCDTRQRNILARQMGEDGWHLQVDADEYVLNCKDFVDYLHTINPKPNRPCTIFANLIPLIKKTPSGYLVVKFPKRNYEIFPLAFYLPHFRAARQTGSHCHLSRCIVFHQTLSRSPQEVKNKLANWGHNKDFDGDAFFSFWDSLDEGNYRSARNFHPLYPSSWPKLELVRARDIDELIAVYRPEPVSLIRRLMVSALSFAKRGRG